MDEARNRGFLANALRLSALFLLLWAGIKYALPPLLPFLLSFISAGLLEPCTAFLTRRLRLKRGFSAAFVCIFFLLAALSALFLLLYGASGFLLNGVKSLPFSAISARAQSLLAELESLAPRGLDLSGLFRFLEKLPERLYEGGAELLSSLASCAPGCFLFLLAYGISLFFFSSTYPEVKGFLLRQIPEKNGRALLEGAAGALSAWLRAQFILMLLTFAQLFVVLLLLRVRNALEAALLTAMVDALPVLGVGTVLVPWALLCLLSGESARGVGLLISYCLISLVRSFLEPKLLGAHFGLHPAAALICAYVGFRFAGLYGLLILPILLLLLKKLSDEGAIRLWK